ncbi:hypothetical protein [Nocardia pseudobrasiliensis]|uniref:Uncharacterized protein n=1 Tax=Nocardia pseudobrasiliensis TaxID=45979 RepID=A0A370I3J9_9NOCA|nr:hypothetical protein [Nocardia pseudobrasiliensis]RDI63894.1 hypothetical protein DFR76_109234 [Nocardia pseudobrasiliensis]
MSVVTDAEILVALLPLYPLVAEREAMMRAAERGDRMVELDNEIFRTAAEALRGIGLAQVAWAVEAVADNRLRLGTASGPRMRA